MSNSQQPSRFSIDPEEKKAGIWAHKQKIAYKKGNLSKEQVDALNATVGWTWDIEVNI